MLKTPLTKLVGCERPLQLAAMRGVVTPELAIAVANSGGLAMLPTTGLPLPEFRAEYDSVRTATSAPLGVNFLVPFLDHEVLEFAASAAKVVEFFYGEPSSTSVEIVHRGGALACWQVGSIEEARAAVDAGCDILVAQGVEAGGHVRGEVATLSLLSGVLDAVAVPVVAAGGIGTARSVAAALAAGAAGVRIGTRFVATHESGAHPSYVAALLRARAEDTELTSAFSVMWPDAPHRVLRSCIEAATALTGEIAGEMPMGSTIFPLPRFGAPLPTRETTGHIDAMALYAGHSVDAVRQIDAAAGVVRELCDGAEELLRKAVAGLDGD